MIKGNCNGIVPLELVLAIGIALAPSAHAQDTQETDSQAVKPAARARTVELQKVTVTAEKRPEDLQKTSIAIAVVEAEQMQQQHRKTATDLVADMPGVDVRDTTAGPQFVIRGVQSTGRPGGELAVPIYRDGVYSDRIDSARSTLLDVDHVEVLKGPQGTLFGRNALGGAINILYNQPKLGVTEGSLSAGLGNYSLREGEAVLNLPAGDRFALRVGISSSQRDGYMSNGTSDNNDRVGRVKLRWRPNDLLDMVLTAEKNKVYGKGNGDTELTSDWPSRVGWNPWYSSNTQKVYKVTHQDLANLQVNVETPIGTLSLIPSYLKSHFTADQVSNGVEQIEDRTQTQKTVEARLVSKADSPLLWQLGGYYYNADEPQTFSTLVGPLANGYPVDLTPRNETTSYAVFGQATVPLNDRWRLVAGARYTQDRRSVRFASGDFGSGGSDAEMSGQYKYHRPTWKAGVEWDSSASSMTYAAVSTGYRAGDITMNWQGITPGKAQLMTQYAIGNKWRLWGDRAQLNTELFYNDYTNYPIGLSYIDTSTSQQYSYSTQSKMVMKGIDADLKISLGVDDKIDAGFSYLDARYGKQAAFNDASITDPVLFAAYAAQLATYSDATKTSAPRTSWRAGYRHYFTFADGAQLEINPTIRYSASYYTNTTTASVNDPLTLQPHYYQYDLYLNYSAARGNWGVGAYGKNLTNEAVVTNYNESLSADTVDTVFVAAPRTWGVQGWYKF